MPNQDLIESTFAVGVEDHEGLNNADDPGHHPWSRISSGNLVDDTATGCANRAAVPATGSRK
jgi:hypothetical protein